MNRLLIGALAVGGFAVAIAAHFANSADDGSTPATITPVGRNDRVFKTDDEWKALLTEEQYRVTRAKGTERACSGQFWDSKADGIYCCVCCGLDLFDSRTKFDSGTGWPSFYAPMDAAAIACFDEHDFMMRTEIRCNRCDAHLGHVFNDGPPPTGRRFCLNSVALRLRPRE